MSQAWRMLVRAVLTACEAAEAALVAVALDPGSVGYVNGAMQHLAFAGRYPEAIRFANRFWEMDSTLLSAGLV